MLTRCTVNRHELLLLYCRMYQDKLASLKRQLQQLHEGNCLCHTCCASTYSNNNPRSVLSSGLDVGHFGAAVFLFFNSNTAFIWKDTIADGLPLWSNYLLLCRHPAGIPEEDEKAGPAVQRETPKRGYAKNISACAFIPMHPCWTRLQSLVKTYKDKISSQETFKSPTASFERHQIPPVTFS